MDDPRQAPAQGSGGPLVYRARPGSETVDWGLRAGEEATSPHRSRSTPSRRQTWKHWRRWLEIDWGFECDKKNMIVAWRGEARRIPRCFGRYAFLAATMTWWHCWSVWVLAAWRKAWLQAKRRRTARAARYTFLAAAIAWRHCCGVWVLAAWRKVWLQAKRRRAARAAKRKEARQRHLQDEGTPAGGALEEGQKDSARERAGSVATAVEGRREHLLKVMEQRRLIRMGQCPVSLVLQGQIREAKQGLRAERAELRSRRRELERDWGDFYGRRSSDAT